MGVFDLAKLFRFCVKVSWLKSSELEPCTGRKYQATIWFTYDKVSYVTIRAYDSKNVIRMIRMPNRCWDIRDHSRKLSEIAPKFGRFLALPNFRGRAFRKLYARYHPCLATRRLEKFHEDISTSPEVIGVHTRAGFKGGGAGGWAPGPYQQRAPHQTVHIFYGSIDIYI